MTALILIAIDLVAMAALVFGLYFPRHRRADLVAAFLGVNVGVLAVTIILANSTVSAGLGLGLFGVLSIIRLRSDQISQTEIAYYFASLALGLLTGMSSAVTPLLGGLIAPDPRGPRLGDSKLIFGRYTSQTVQLDRAIADPAELKAALEQRPGRVRRLGECRQARPRERPDSRGRALEGRLTRRPVSGHDHPPAHQQIPHRPPLPRTRLMNATLNSLLADLDVIGLDELNERAAMLTRVDRKYIVDAETAAKVLSTLDADASVMEIDGQRDFAYDSVYFDTPQMQSYHSAAYSRDDTFKIRTRSYLDSELTFLEVKTDGEQDMTVKKRIPYTFENRDTLTAEGHEYITAALGDILAGPVHKLEAVLTTGYRRTTVFLPQSEKNPVASRMTVDNALTWTPMSENILMAGVNYRNFHGNLVGTTYGLPNAVIIETKSGVEPSVADQHLWDAGITPAKISKFATGMAALNPQLASNKWEETLKNWMHLEPVEGTRLNVDDMTEEDYQKLLTERFAAA